MYIILKIQFEPARIRIDLDWTRIFLFMPADLKHKLPKICRKNLLGDI